MGEIGISIVNLGFQAICLVALLVVLARVRAFKTLVAAAGPLEQKLHALERAAGGLAEATREAQALCVKLEQLTLLERPLTQQAGVTEEAAAVSGAGGTGGQPLRSDGESWKPKIASPEIRKGFDTIRELSASNASLDQMCEQTGLSESEIRFVLEVLGSKMNTPVSREET